MKRPTLPERIVAVHNALAAVPHAFGGALALAYHAEPRATRDIDCNVFVDATSAPEVLDPLATIGADVTGAVDAVAGDGQVRIMWDDTPIDLFFAYDAFHAASDRGAVDVPFADTTIRVLSATHLTICKVVFDRPRDWVDVGAMVEAGAAIDAAEVMRWVGRICGDTDRRYRRIAAVLLR
ncbi:MAG: nucleotidyl transferase AbiEii/AbiGii toxin family protein [Actinobacteria bacterium]|nr:nucleotidyl transferase AbiEii/AbiGii toxin family protein [Actinomycetota bacterium]